MIKREESSYTKIKNLKYFEIKIFQNTHKTFMGKIINHTEREKQQSRDMSRGYEEKE